MSCVFVPSAMFCVNTRGLLLSAVTNQVWQRVLQENQHCIRRQHKLELNYYRNTHSLLFPLLSAPLCLAICVTSIIFIMLC